jgi:hypothetical protein
MTCVCLVYQEGSPYQRAQEAIYREEGRKWDMELQEIRIFVMCAKYLSFSRVAELTYTSQPSITPCSFPMFLVVGVV